MPEIFSSNLDSEKSIESLELIETVMSIQSHLKNQLDAEENAPAVYIHGYCKALLDFSSLLYEEFLN